MTKTLVAAVSLCATDDVSANVRRSLELIEQAAGAGAQAVFLPEAFAFIGGNKGKRAMAEVVPGSGPIFSALQESATRLSIDIVAGGFHEAIPGETDNGSGQTWNTCLHFNSAGELAARYRKIHLFDVELADGTVLTESANTRAGDELVTTELGFGTLGLSICYDVRFPELYQRLTDAGAIAHTVPSAFTAHTGAAHWHTLLRARAIETSSYVIAPAQYGQHNPRRRSFGHSLIVDPWGEVLADHNDGDGFAMAAIEPERVASVRAEMPSLRHRVPLS